ncbi:hypothetical protein Tco_0323431 [Tanacetum coccineum]
MRYVDTKPNDDALRKCIQEGPYKLSTVTIPGQPATDDSPAVEEQTVLDTLLNMSSENKAHYDAEKEAIHLILTGIGDEIYSAVDACKTAHEMWIAIERLQQGESLNKQDVKTSLFWEFGRFTSRDEETIESYYSKFYKMMNEMMRNQLEVATTQVNLFDILKQYHKEVDEIRAKKIARNTNSLALVAVTQQYPDTYYQAPKSHKLYPPISKQSSSTRSHVSTRHKGKKIAKPITPPSELASEEDSDPEQAHRDKEMQKNLALIARYKNDNQTGQFENQRTVTVAGARETIGSQLDGMDEEFDEQELEAHYMYMAKIQEVPTTNSGPSFDVEPLEEVDSNVIPDSSDMCDNKNQSDQNAEECDDERVVLANLIANFKLDTDENKKIQKQLKKANTSLSHELQKCKSALEECKSSLENSNRTRDTCIIALQTKEIELEKYKTYHNRTLKHYTLERQLKETLGLLAQKEYDIKEEIDELEFDKADFSNIYDLLLQEFVSKDVMCSYLHSLSDFDAYNELKCLYLHKVKECECLTEKFSKQTKNASKEVSKQNGSTVFLKEREQYFEIQDLKAQPQDKNIAISELKKLIEKMKGKGVDTNFEKPSILGKPPSQTIRNQLVVRQPTAYKSERSQIPKHRRLSFAKPYDVNAPGPSRNSSKHVSFKSPKESVGSFDMVHNYYLEEAKNKVQLQKDKALNTKSSVQQSARLPNTTNEPSRNQKHFLKSKDLACPTCKKCIYSTNHDECILKYLSKVNSRASAQKKDAQSHKTTKRYIPVEKKSDSKKHDRQIPIGQMFSPNKSSVVYLKTTPPRSGHTWKPTGRIFTQNIIVILFSIHNDDGNPSRANIKQDLRRVGFITTCSCSNYKDILLASRFKNQESTNSKTKTFANSDIQDLPLRYQVYQGRLLASFQNDAKYKHISQDPRSQDGKDNKDKQRKYLKISEQKTKSKDNDRGSRSNITKREETSLQHDKDQRFKNSMTNQSQQVQESKI